MIRKRNYLVYILLVISLPVLSQQNLFNVPSSDITLKGKVFFQQQFNINRDLYQSNTTLCYGLGGNAEIGLNLIALNFDPKGSPLLIKNGDTANPPLYPFYTLNVQKAFVLTKVFKLAVGTQAGLADCSHFGAYAYLNVITAVTKTQSKIVSGLYYGSNSFLGSGDRNPFFSDVPLGFQIGLEQTIIHEKLFLVAENISGKHSLGETTIGIAWFASKHWMLSCGYQFANPSSNTMNALVVELTFVPAADVHKRIYRHGHDDRRT